MPDETFQNRPSDNPALGSYVTAEAGSTDRNALENQRLEVLYSEVQRLRSRLGWLSGLSIAALALTGLLAGLVFNMKLQQDQQKQQFAALTSEKAGLESQINSLEQQATSVNQQLTSVNQQIPKNLSNQLKATQTQLKQLQASIQEINSKAITSEQLNAALQRAQRNLNNARQTSPPSTFPTPRGVRESQSRTGVPSVEGNGVQGSGSRQLTP